MRVLLGEPAGWYLLEDNGELYLDVNCNQSAVGFGITVRLDPAERAAFAERGRAFAAELAEQIAYSPRTLLAAEHHRPADRPDHRGDHGPPAGHRRKPGRRVRAPL